MEIQLQPTLIITFFLTVLIPSRPVDHRNLAGSPSSAVQVNGKLVGTGKNLFEPVNKKLRRVSSPARCQSECNQCMPCTPVEVAVRAEEQEEN